MEGSEWKNKARKYDCHGLPGVCWRDDKDGGLGGLGWLFLGLFGRLRLPHLLLKTVQLPPKPRYGTVFRQVVFCAVAALTCIISGGKKDKTFLCVKAKKHNSLLIIYYVLLELGVEMLAK